MNKDAVLASGIGFGIGLLITGGILLGPNMIKQFQAKMKSGDVQSATTQSTISPTSTPQSTVSDITIEEPTSDAIVTKSSVSVKGKATNGSYVVIASDVDETVIAVSSSETYEGTISMKPGKNDITVTNIVGDKETQKKVTVFLEPSL